MHPIFRHHVGEAELALRRLYSDGLRRLGLRSHVILAQGLRFHVDTEDLIDRSLAHFGMWEGGQIEDLAQACLRHRADCFLDIGANAGVYSLMLASRRIVPRIVAFEPDPGNFARLMANLEANGLQNAVEALPLALGHAAGDVTLMQSGDWNRGESWIAHPDKPPEEAPGVATHVVRQVRFDDEFAMSGQMLVVKMDVEGSEFHALTGMRRTLAENRCYLQVELYSNRFEELKALFAGLGYRYLRTDNIDHIFTNVDPA